MIAGFQSCGCGLGQASTTSTVVSSVGTGILASAPLTGPAAPFVALAGGLVALAGGLLSAFGVGVPDEKKIQASQDANQVEALMAANQQQFLAGPHTVAAQQQAVAYFNACWQQLVTLCSNPALGTAGQNCISDRQRGGKWDWFAMHLDPILNTPPIDANPITGATASLTSSLGISPIWLGVGILALAMMSD